MRCEECLYQDWNEVTQEVDCGLPVEVFHKCPNLGEEG